MVQKIKYRHGSSEPWTVDFVWIPDNLSDEDKLLYAEMNMNTTGIKFTEVKLAEPCKVSKYADANIVWIVILGVAIGTGIILFILE